MRYIKKYESFEEGDLGLIDLVGSECFISISIGTKYNYYHKELMSDMINDYKEMYIRNKDWSGGPCNKEWLIKYHKFFNVTFEEAYSAWKPSVILNIKTDKFGIPKLGFSIYSKIINSFNWSEMRVKSDYYEKSLINLKSYITKELCNKKKRFDDVISLLDLNCDFYYTSIMEDNNI